MQDELGALDDAAAAEYALFSWPGADDVPRAVSPAGLPSSLDFLEDEVPC